MKLHDYKKLKGRVRVLIEHDIPDETLAKALKEMESRSDKTFSLDEIIGYCVQEINLARLEKYR